MERTIFFQKETYETILPALEGMEKTVAEMLIGEIGKANIPTLEIAHRIKAQDSALEKLKRKADNYSSVEELTDLLGFRIICYFSDDVDKVAAVVEKLFIIDRENSVDKRQTLSPTAFGYLSLHYICSLPESDSYPKEYCGIKFEIQMRSSLQHTWAEIEHDLGYKSAFAIPKEVRREFSRIAGLLELADESFMRIRNRLNEYTRHITAEICSGRALGLSLDLVTLKTYMQYNHQMGVLLRDIAEIQGMEIVEQSPESYLQKLEVLGIMTLGDLEELLTRQRENALRLAKQLFESAELDEIASTAGLHFLCRAELLYGDHSDEVIKDFFAAGTDNKLRAKQQALRLIKKRREVSPPSL